MDYYLDELHIDSAFKRFQIPDTDELLICLQIPYLSIVVSQQCLCTLTLSPANTIIHLITECNKHDTQKGVDQDKLGPM